MKSSRKLSNNTVTTAKSPRKPDKKASWEHVRKLFEGVTFADEDVTKARRRGSGEGRTAPS